MLEIYWYFIDLVCLVVFIFVVLYIREISTIDNTELEQYIKEKDNDNNDNTLHLDA